MTMKKKKRKRSKHSPPFLMMDDFLDFGCVYQTQVIDVENHFRLVFDYALVCQEVFVYVLNNHEHVIE